MAPHQATSISGELQLVDWRRRVATLYAAVRAEPSPVQAHALWRRGRDELMREHAESPLLPGDELRRSGVPYWPYDPELRFALERPAGRRARDADPPDRRQRHDLAAAASACSPSPRLWTRRLDVWWMEQYAGGMFVPLRDGTAGDTSYGGGRYLLDTAKGADLGSHDGRVVVDLNFLYHPSCRYNADWQCPLAPPGNTIDHAVRAGERL